MIEDRSQNISSTAPMDDAYVMPFGELIRTLWRRAWLILLVSVVCSGTALGLGLARQPVYEASVEVLVGQERAISESPTDAAGLQDLTVTMTQLVSNRPLAEEVIEEHGLRTTPETFLEEQLSVSQIEDSQIIEVSYTDTDPRRAQQVVNTVGEVFSQRIADVSSNANAITATVWERAAVPDNPVSPNPVRDSVLAALLGAVLGVGLAFLLEFFDDRWRSPEELEQVSGVPVFGIIPEFEVKKIVKKGKG